MVSKSPTQPLTIISASRRTDIPAFHGKYFLKAVKNGWIEVPNPFNNKKYKVSLRPEDVGAIVFWSRNYRPFLQILHKIRNIYQDKFLFHFTITGYLGKAKTILEPKVPELEESLKCIKKLAKEFGKEKIFWRYDPVIFSNLTDFQERLVRFEAIINRVRPYVARCYFSYIDIYNKVKRRLERIDELRLMDPNSDVLINFARELKQIADTYELPIFTCCEESIRPYTDIEKGHCIDADYLSHLFSEVKFTKKINPTRSGCGCYDSRDIGAYN